MKENAIKEVAKKFADGLDKKSAEDFICGAKWQEKRMYSEKEVLKMFSDYKFKFYVYRNMQVLPNMFDEWFKKYKK